MKLPLRTIIAVFILWIIGIVILFFVINVSDDKYSKGSRWFFLHSLSNAESYFLRRKAATLQPQQLPQISDHLYSGIDEADSRIRVYLEWPLSGDAFTIHNYRSLESMLAVYSHAVIRCVVMPNSDITKRKLPGVIAYNMFQKYRKGGHDIKVASATIDNHHYYKRKNITKSNKYLQTWVLPCSAASNSSSQTPYHLSNYFRLLSLWRTGGLFADFSFYFLDNLNDDSIEQGYYINSYCFAANNKKVYRPRSFDTWQALTCFTSTLLLFKQKHSLLLDCMLDKYHFDSIFLVCIESDPYYHGSICIKKAFAQCFEAQKAANGLDNDLEQSDTHLLESFNREPLQANTSLLSNNWTLMSTSRVLWMGHLAWQGSNQLYPYQLHSLLHDATSQTQALKPTKVVSRQCSNYASQLHVPANLPQLLQQTYQQHPQPQTIIPLSDATSIGHLSCAPSVFIAGFLHAGSHALYELLQLHPQVLATTCGFGYEHSDVYSALSMDGGASQGPWQMPRRLDRRAACYPFIESGEGYVSMDGNALLHADPVAPMLIQQDNAHAKVIFVLQQPVWRLYLHYAHLHAQQQLQVGFDSLLLEVLSNPESSVCQLRKMLSNCSSLQEVISYFYQSPAEAYNITGGSANANASAEGVWMVEDMLRQSMYALSIEHFAHVLGADQLLVLLDEDLQHEQVDVRRQSMRKVYAFLDLPLIQYLPASAASQQLLQRMPAAHRMSQDMFCKLNTFFAPFASLFGSSNSSQLRQLNLSAWHEERLYTSSSSSSKISQLPEYGHPENTSWPLLWFELDEEEEGDDARKSLSHRLVPQRLSSEDNGFNTTLGMLNTF